MYDNENFKKIAKIFIFAFMCSQMESSFTQQNASQNRSASYTNTANGTQVSTENAKFLASIRLKALDKIFGDGHICSGALIAPSVVVTVAQCVHNFNKDQPRHPSEFKIVMGTVNRYESNADTLSYGVTHIYQPNTFEKESLRDNVAILMLEKDVPIDHLTIEPIIFEMRGTSALGDAAGLDKSFEYITWGTNKKGLPLDEALLLNSTKEKEQNCFNQMYPLYTAPGSLCIKPLNKNENICPSDAGAPLISDNKLYGLASFGQGCSTQSSPVVFTDVTHHSAWILSKIGDGGNQNSSIWGFLGFLLFTLYTLKTSKVFKS